MVNPKTFSIGPLAISDPVWLAPMTGVSDLPFRKLVKGFGAGMVVSEMIASRAAIIDNQNFKRMSSFDASEYPFAIQLAGCDPDIMADAAKLNEDRGANIIDINFDEGMLDSEAAMTKFMNLVSGHLES